MDFGIAGKVALVTGGSRGLGLATARTLGREGCRVVIAARDRRRIDEALQTLRGSGCDAVGESADITSKEDVTQLFAQLAGRKLPPDILVYNNGGPPNHSFDQAEEEDYLEAYRRMVLGFAWCVKAAVPHMKEKCWGRIVTLGSMCVKEPHRELPMVLHNLTRPAAVGLSKTLSDELGEFGITVNTIGTGTIDSGDEDSTFRINYRAAARERGITFEQMKAIRVAPTPVKRAGTPKEIAAACAFLCSAQAGYITGQTLLVDGGRVRAYL